MQASQRSLDEAEARTAPRTNLYLAAVISFDGGSAPVRLRDLSAFGARIEGSLLPSKGASANITRGTLAARGTIVWRDSRGCGIRFERPLPLDRWVPLRERPPQRKLTLSDEAMTVMLPVRMAEELAYVARLLESLGDDLSSERLVVMRHAGKLQYLDISTQILGHLAAVLVADQPAQAIGAIGMENLRKRLQRVTL
jgi:hypothetical protein